MNSQNTGRMFLAVALSFLILYFWSRTVPPPATTEAPVTQSAPFVGGETALPNTKTENTKAKTGAGVLRKAQAPTVVFQNDKWRMNFNLGQGASVGAIELVDYTTNPDRRKASNVFRLGHQEKTLVLAFSHPELQVFNEAPFVVEKQSQGGLSFVQESKEFLIRREFRAQPQSYALQWRVEIQPKKSQKGEFGEASLLLANQLTEEKTSSINVDEVSASISQERLTHLYTVKASNTELVPDAKELSKWAAFQGKKVDWLAVGDRYFIQALVPEGKYNPNVSIRPVQARPGMDTVALLTYPVRLDGTPMIIEGSGFFGPKSLRTIGVLPVLSTTIDLGIWRLLSEPIVRFLNFIYTDVFPNYGLAIILLTLVVRLLLLPLVHKQIKSMKRLQDIQPELTRLKERYKDDKQKQTQEVMQFMRAQKVNPLGGCLPLLFQMPIFLALWQALSNTADLFHAPFILWIHDLSAKDPYYVLPVLMSALMFVQQLLTPKSPAMDKTQQKMMLFLPLVFSVFMLNLPSGLNLYMVTSTLFGLVQQLVIQMGQKKASNQLAFVNKE